MRVDICINTRDRWTELGLLLQSLRVQTFKDFDIIIVDGSQTPIQQSYFLNKIMRQLVLEGNNVTIERANLMGVCEGRNQCAKLSKNELICRVDDDVILEPDYLERLYHQIDLDNNVLLSSGVTPGIGTAPFKRLPKFVKPIINEIKLDKEGNIIKMGDDCGMQYLTRSPTNMNALVTNIINGRYGEGEHIIPAHHLRSCFMYHRKLHDEWNIWYEKGLSHVGFREETFFCLRAKLKGAKMTVDLNAKAWHLQTPSGGCRFQNYNELVAHDNYRFSLWVKRMFQEHGNFLEAKK